MAFKAQRGGVCSGCAETIHPGDYIWWARVGELKGKTFHSGCGPKGKGDISNLKPETKEIPTPPPSEIPLYSSSTSSTSSNGNGHHDPLASMLASALNPFIQAKTEDIDAKIDAAVTAAMSAWTLNNQTNVRTETVILKDAQQVGKVEGTQHELFPLLMQMIVLRQPVYLWGEAGSGKSTAAHVAATALNLPFYYLALNRQMTMTMLMGYNDGYGVYRETDFFRAYTQGGVFLLDELELGDGNLLGSLNGALANGHASFPCGIKERHPDFVCVATGNTPALGATEAYSDRRALDQAVRDRFAFIEWNTDPKLEIAAARAQFADADEWVAWVQKTRETIKRISPRLIVTQRASVAGAKLLSAGLSPEQVAEMLVFRGFDKNSVSHVLNANPLPRY